MTDEKISEALSFACGCMPRCGSLFDSTTPTARKQLFEERHRFQDMTEAAKRMHLMHVERYSRHSNGSTRWNIRGVEVCEKAYLVLLGCSADKLAHVRRLTRDVRGGDAESALLHNAREPTDGEQTLHCHSWLGRLGALAF